MQKSYPAAALVLMGIAASAQQGALAAEPDATPAARPATAPAEEVELSEVVVTAQGRKESLQTVPLSVSVISGDALAKSGIRNLDDLSSRLANVKITAGSSSDVLAIRGVGSVLNPGIEQAVSTFVDGVYRGRSRAVRASMFDVDRVEVLKGPQTTFFGNNAIAGAFNITTRQPSQQFAYNSSLSYGTDDKYAIEAGLTTPLTDTLSMRVAGKAYGGSGFVENTYTGKEGPRTNDGIARVSLLWEPSEVFSSRVRVDRVRMRDNDANPSELINCPPAQVAARGACLTYLNASGGVVDDRLDLKTATVPSRFDYDMTEAAWINEFRFAGFTLQATTAYFHHDVDNVLSLIPVPTPGVGGNTAVSPLVFGEKYHDFSQEIRLISPEDRTVTYLAGLYYEQGQLAGLDFSGYYYTPFGAQAAPFYTANDRIVERDTLDQDDQVISGFAAATWHIADVFRLNGGMRYSVVHKTAHRFLETGVATSGPFPSDDNFVRGTPEQQAALFRVLGVSPADYLKTSITNKKFMPTVSAQYDLTPAVMTYASFTKGFKAGGFPTGFQPVAPFGPENVKAYEVGTKTTFFDRRLVMNVAAFWNDYTDLQESTSITRADGVRVALVQNASAVRSRGIETNATFRLNQMFQFNTDFAYLDARYRSFPNGPCTDLQSLVIPRCLQDLAGKARPYAPKWSGSAGMTYTQPVGESSISFEPVVRFTSRYVQQVNNNPLYYQEGYRKVDARLAYTPASGRWQVALVGTNLTDKITASYRNNAATSPGTFYALPEEGREAMIQFSINN